jgi:hypothetical protein
MGALDTAGAAGLVAGRPQLKGEKMQTVQVRITRNTVAGGKPVAPGQIVDLIEAEARFLMGIKKAEVVKTAPSERPTAGDGPAPENREDDLLNRMSKRDRAGKQKRETGKSLKK